MEYMFDLCINTSIKGSILIIIVLGIQRIFRKDFSSKWIYTLWLLVLIRLLSPSFPIKSSLNLYNLGLIKRLQFNIHDMLLGRLASAYDGFETMGKSMQINEFVKNSMSFHWKYIFIHIWVIGLFLLFCVFFYMTFRIKMILKHSEKVTESGLIQILNNCRQKLRLQTTPDLYISSELSTPTTFGVFYPKIILPESVILNMKEQNLEHILLHELTHIKRHDITFSMLGLLTCIIHWFNPIVWIGFIKSKNDCELACDENVLKCLTHEEYTKYGHTLIQMLELVSTNNTFYSIISKSLINDRFEANSRIFQISKFYRKRKSVVVLSFVVLIFLTFIGINESPSTRPSNIYGKYHLSDYLHATEEKVRQTFGKDSKHNYVILAGNTPYYILHYNILGEKAQFWYDGTIGNNQKKTLEITTTSYKGIRQGMAMDKAKKAAYDNFNAPIEVQKTESLTKYIYEDIHCHVMVLFDSKMDKVYSISLF